MLFLSHWLSEAIVFSFLFLCVTIDNSLQPQCGKEHSTLMVTPQKWRHDQLSCQVLMCENGCAASSGVESVFV